MRPLSVLPLVVLAACSCGAGPGESCVVAAADLATLPRHDRRFQRYAAHPGPRADVEEFDALARYHANQLSRKGQLQPPARVAFDLWRFDLRHYGWDAATWEKFAARNVYFVRSRTRTVTRTVGRGRQRKEVRRKVAELGQAEWLPADAAAFLVEETRSDTPVVSAPWWLTNTCRQLTLTNEQLGFGYYDFLGVKNRDDFFALTRFKLRDSIDLEFDQLEAVDESGVATQNRRVDAERALSGWAFFTLDTDDESGRGNAVENLRREDYVHRAEEWYLPLVNGLPANLLCDNNGVLQASAPDFIGSDRSANNTSNDPRIHVCVSCLGCHAKSILQPVDGWARREYTVGRLLLGVAQNYGRLSKRAQADLFEELKRQYLIANFTQTINDQREAYRRKVVEACGLDPGDLSERFTRAYHRYAHRGVTLEQAARELGYTPGAVRRAFERSSSPETGTGAVRAQLGALVKNPSTPIKRIQWEQFYPEAQEIMLTYGRKE